MAVFPDHIVLKNSADTDASVRAAIGSGGASAIKPGEIVVRRASGQATLYTLDAAGDVVEIVSGGSVGTAGVTEINYLAGSVNSFGASNLSDVQANGDSLWTSTHQYMPVREAEGSTEATVFNGVTATSTTAYGVNAAVVSGVGAGGKSCWSLNNGYVYWSNQNWAPNTTDFTVEMIVKLRNLTAQTHLISMQQDNAAKPRLNLWHQNGVVTLNYTDNNTEINDTGNFTFATDTFYRIWIDRDVAAQDTAVYILNLTTLAFNNIIFRNVDTGPINGLAGTWIGIGAQHDGSSWVGSANMLVQDVRITNTRRYGPGAQNPSNVYVPLPYPLHNKVQTNGQVLTWNATSKYWYPATPSGGGGSTDLDGLTDVTISAPSNGQVLSYNGVAWVNTTPSSGSVNLDGLTDVTITTPANGQALVYNGSQWVNSTVSTVGSINDLTDVDTSTVPPLNGQSLVWNGSNWVPYTVSGGGGGGGGGGTGTVLDRVTDTGTASSGLLTLTGLGSSGVLVDVTSSLDAWVVLYPTDADRAADAARAYGVDPAPGSGVLAEFYITAAGTVLASPGTTYFNNDTVVAEAIYLAVRNQSGAAVDSEITIDAYVHKNFGGFGTIRVADSGTAASGVLDLTGMGQSGQLCTVTSDMDAWIVLYGSAADRTADNARTFSTDPTPGSGVQAEFFVTAGATVLATPGSVYFNNDTSPTDAMYLAVRDQAGSGVDATVTIVAYAETSYTGVSGGTFGSG